VPDVIAQHVYSTPKPVPFLKWAGGKTQLLKQYERFFVHSYNRYYEPFLGSGAVFLHLRPSQATLNDSNPCLVAAYRHIQHQLDDLLARLHVLRRDYHALPPTEQENVYYQLRARYNALPTGTLEKTALLIVLNKTGYNGLYRENASGAFNVPFGRYDNPAIFRAENLRAVSRALQSACLLHTGFEEAVATARPGDFVYFDPPYVPVSKTASFTSYTRGDFGPEMHTRLAAIAWQLARRGVQVMLSNSDTPLVRDLYHGFHQHQVRASRAINSDPGARGKINELVITSYAV
jgi:DNA adenine methylase